MHLGSEEGLPEVRSERGRCPQDRGASPPGNSCENTPARVCLAAFWRASWGSQLGGQGPLNKAGWKLRPQEGALGLFPSQRCYLPRTIPLSWAPRKPSMSHTAVKALCNFK